MRVLAVVGALALMCILVSSAFAQSVPEGTPYLIVNVSCPTGFDELELRTMFATFLRSNFQATIGNIQPGNIAIHDPIVNITGDITQMHLSILRAYANNARAYLHLQQSLPYFAVSTVFLEPFTTAPAVLVENPSTLVIVSFPDSFALAYNGSNSPQQVVSLDFSPGLNMAVNISLVSDGVIVTPHPIRIAWPNLQASFIFRSHVPALYSFTASIDSSEDTTPMRVYTFARPPPSFLNSYRQNVSITPPPPTIVTHENTWSPNFEIRVPAVYRDATMNVIVGVSSNFLLDIEPRNVALTRRDVPFAFRVRGAAGTYEIRYTIGPPTGPASADNINFFSPTEVTTFVIAPPLNITVTRFPDAFMVNPVAHSEYGGATVRGIFVHLERRPKVSLTVTLRSNAIDFTPASLTFSSAGAQSRDFNARALITGVHTVYFDLSGPSAEDYAPVPIRRWVVHGPNPSCVTNAAQEGCWEMRGCQWNEDLSRCSNRSLPISIARIPVLFDEEASVPVLVRLPTPVRSSLTIQFVAAARLVFSPASITLPVGSNEFNVSVTGFMDPMESWVTQPFYLKLTGPDANTYVQQEGAATIRSKIKCNVTTPLNFFVNTESEEFLVACDSAPEVDVVITPRSLPGIAFVPLGSVSGDGMFFDPETSTGRFFAVSTQGRTGNFPINFVISGANAPRYDVIPVANIIIYPSGEVLTPPTFYQTAFEESNLLNMDITVESPRVLEVAIFATFENGTNASNIRLTPEVMVYNATRRGFLRVFGTIPGAYYLNFRVSGVNMRNYIEPAPRKFFIMDRLDGSAYTARLSLGFVPSTRCRANVGRNSEVFRGQEPIDMKDAFCEVYRPPPQQPNVSYDCGQHLTEERCRNALSVTGFVCVWHVVDARPQCIHLPALQGILHNVAYGSGYTLLQDIWGGVWSIGSTRYGQLGHFNDFLTRVPLPENVSEIVAGTSHSMALTPEGDVYAWGVNVRGQLGINSPVQQTETPTKAVFPRGERVTCLSAGTLHSAAITQTGRLYTWGANDFGQLGNEVTFREQQRVPIALGRDLFNGDPILGVQCGEFHTMVATDIQVYTFGSNFMGQLGRPGFDEWKPRPPIHYVLNRYRPVPSYPSFVMGHNRCNQGGSNE